MDILEKSKNGKIYLKNAHLDRVRNSIFSPKYKRILYLRHFKLKTMGQILHGTATTTQRIGKEIQASNSPLKDLALRYNINIKTVRKWKYRGFVEDLQLKTLLPLDDLYLVLKPIIPELSRSNLHRCL